ncbi:MAG: DUF4142 domain-containing protein [Proteobacteria bacterium]|nr:DUF4142 domain-containing protein [Pseudomonadota bacterium]
MLVRQYRRVVLRSRSSGAGGCRCPSRPPSLENPMNSSTRLSVLAASIAAAVGLAASGFAAAQAQQPRAQQSSAQPAAQQPAAQRPAAAPGARGAIERGTVDRIIAGWAAHPRLGAQQMMAKYGPPQEASGMMLVWHEAGPFKRIKVMNLETPHDFPMPHVDFMEHTISYMVPEDKLGDLLVFDGSSTINRTTGELSARCDLENHNILTFNLDHDIVTGAKTVAEARQAFGEIVKQELMGERPPYTQELQFDPLSPDAAMFSDEPVMPGSPLRAAEVQGNASGDAMALAAVAMIDMNEIKAAMQAKTKNLSPPVMEYANMLHQEHGMNISQTLQTGQQAGVTPVITSEVSALSKKGAEMLAPLAALEGEAFERGYLDAMVKGHTDALAKLDNELMQAADNEAVTSHLTKTRQVVADHLAKAKELQGQR